jgi:FSR family fosmidomycin resistance protein-like MFS transporter
MTLSQLSPKCNELILAEPMAPFEASQHANVRIILTLTLIHFIGDFYNAFVTPLLPLFVDKFALSLAQAGLITGVSRFLAFVIQPQVGYLADRYPSRYFPLVGLLVVTVFISLTGVSPWFWLLLLFISLGSIGSSMFHPTAAGMISDFAGKHLGFSLSVFNMGGTLAFAAGPLFIAWQVSNFGLQSMPWAIVIGLVAVAILYKTLPPPPDTGLGGESLLGSIKTTFGAVWKPIVLIWLVMALRAFVSQSFMTFLPVLYAQEGYSLMSLGAMISLYTVAGAMSGLLAGHLSDRIGFKSIFLVFHTLSVPSIYLLLAAPGRWVYPCAFLTGFFLLATLPLGVALAQKLAPRGKSMASSLMTGLAFGTGGLLTPVTGKLADMYSLRPVLGALAVIPLATVVLILFLPKKT